ADLAFAFRAAGRAFGVFCGAAPVPVGERAVRGGPDRDVGRDRGLRGLRRLGGRPDRPHPARAARPDRRPRGRRPGRGRRHHAGPDPEPALGPRHTRHRGRRRPRRCRRRLLARGLLAHDLRPVRVRGGGRRGGRRLRVGVARGRDEPGEARRGRGGARGLALVAHDCRAHLQSQDAGRDPVLARRLGGREGPGPALAGAPLRLRRAAPRVRPEPPDHGPRARRGRRHRARPAHGVGKDLLGGRGRVARGERGGHRGADRVRRARRPARGALLRRGGLPPDPALLGLARGGAARLVGHSREGRAQAAGAAPRGNDRPRRGAVLCLPGAKGGEGL
ncbi:MAG: Iron(III) dicitrate transport system permease protein FecD, partial [uncultured Rubrobacteraceae bacterium]